MKDGGNKILDTTNRLDSERVCVRGWEFQHVYLRATTVYAVAERPQPESWRWHMSRLAIGPRPVATREHFYSQ